MVSFIAPNNTSMLLLTTSSISHNATHMTQDVGGIDLIAITAPSTVITALIIIINTFVLALFLSKAKLRKSTTNKILLSLVVSDLSTGVILLLHILASVIPTFAIAQTPATRSVRICLDIMTSWIQLVTMGNLALIIFERFITLIHPYKLEMLLGRKRITLAIQTIWGISLLIPCIQLFWVYPYMYRTPTHAEDEQTAYIDSVFSALTIFIFVLIPMTAFFIIFIRMFREIQRFPTIELFNKKQEERRVLKIFAVMYLFFAMFSLPYFLVRLLMDLQEAGHYKVTYLTYFIVTLMKSVPPLLNPFVYVLNKPDFIRELRHKKDTLTNALDRHTRFSSFITTSRRPSNDPYVNKTLLNLQEINNNNREILQDSDSTSAFHLTSRRTSSDTSDGLSVNKLSPKPTFILVTSTSSPSEVKLGNFL
ncbi:D(5)-like dopamine receptor [Clytia hemisphaerica]|uniref:G-protein coupled receptors family 1 profile domain-containing protein n=1 Tax=Clytia hemisphaerica TaxID=252671 RepID=A0A7M6DNV8_9CNID